LPAAAEKGGSATARFFGAGRWFLKLGEGGENVL